MTLRTRGGEECLALILLGIGLGSSLYVGGPPGLLLGILILQVFWWVFCGGGDDEDGQGGDDG